MTTTFKPRRSVLYMPGANARALDKARSLPCDGVIFDLEDAVAADAKAAARGNVVAALQQGGYGHRELVVRVNGLDTPWGAEDIAAVAPLSVDALLFPKVETTAQIDAIVSAMDAAGAAAVPLWFMVETPLAVLDVRALASYSDRLRVLVMGTSDLVKELRAQHTEARHNLAYALQHCVLVARAAGLDLLDGVHLDFRNESGFRAACLQAREMGFDGKSLIHPGQVDAANELFGFDAAAIAHAQRVLEAWQQAQAEGKGVAVLDGKLIENLHAAEAERVLVFAAAVADRDA
ncbi:MAG: HpcH/HpaI aldolase/citrate lyase family protein [Pseudomonadales bacterium]